MSAGKEMDANGSQSFSSVSSLVTGWTLDFMFISLYRYFKEGNLDKFNEVLATFEGISQSPSVKGEQSKKLLICAFLARIMHGKQLDVQFEDEAKVMPLMSAAKVWSELRTTVVDESVYKTINNLLFVQIVAVCLEKSKRSAASSALRWFENNLECPKNVKARLLAIVTKNELQHPILKSFSYSRLLRTIESYLDEYLERNPSDYLLKMATEMVQSSQHMEGPWDSGSQDRSHSESVKNKGEKAEGEVRSKKKLLSTKISDLWEPDTCKKPTVAIKRIPQNELFQLMAMKTAGDSNNSQSQIKKRKPPQKWTAKLDKNLKAGVKRHGQGNWSRILLDYDFEGRTGVMLKDRWRVLVRAYKAS
ncbi:telomeric repeat-binding factor 1 [Takifugu flavidus]|nr:telomeric repeat-binding factor 1 [Takifugu flavidus]